MNLRIIDLTFAYSSVPVLDNICLELPQGEVLSVLGPNGSGKSTLIRCINNIHTPKNGRILLGDKEITKMSQLEIARHIGYVPQSSAQTFPTTVFDAVLLGRLPHTGWRSSDEDVDKVISILRLLEIEDFAMRDFGELSGGEQQKVIFARALAQEPKVLLLDEPTSNLDIKQQYEILAVVRKLKEEQNISVLMAVHDLNLAARFSDSIALLRNGRLIAKGTPDEVLNTETVRDVYGINMIVSNDSGRPYLIPDYK